MRTMFRARILGAAIMAALLSATAAEAAIHWTPMSQKHGGHHQRSAAKMFMLNSGSDAKVHLITPQLDAKPLALQAGHVAVSGTGIDNYHALVATSSSENQTDIAIRYIYMHGRPSGTSPSRITAFSKGMLEIVPDPLPREHWRYYSSDPVTLLVRFGGQPLPDSRIELVSSNGSRMEATTDKSGYATFTLPDDFKDVEPGRRLNRPAELHFTVAHQQENHRYTATLTHDYHVNPSYWQSTAMGIAVVAAGMLAGILLIWLPRRKRG